VTSTEQRSARAEAYEKAANPTLFGMSFVFLAAWTLLVAVTDGPQWFVALLAGAVIAIWVVFVADVVARMTLADSAWRWALAHPLQILGVLLPVLYPFRVLGVFTRETFAAGAKGLLRTGQAVVLSAIVLIWVCAVTVLYFERGVYGASIANFGDALWWACVTVTSVGYGDFAPVTVPGRATGVVLMFAGLSIVGVITATVAAWIVSITSHTGPNPPALSDQELQARVDAAIAQRNDGA